jgi:hypothetical protein
MVMWLLELLSRLATDHTPSDNWYRTMGWDNGSRNRHMLAEIQAGGPEVWPD